MRWLFTIFILIGYQAVVAQGIFISRFSPGNYLSDNSHLVEIANPGSQAANLSGYLLVTRNYSVQLPPNTTIPSRGLIRIGKKSSSTQSLDIELSRTKDFLIRFNLNEDEGNYVCLIDPLGQVVDAFYHSPRPNVPFLPDRDTLITFSGTRIPFYLPPENRQVWSYLSYGENPGISFYQRVGQWQLEQGEAVDDQITSYEEFSARYFDGITTLKWSTRFEENVVSHVVERSENQVDFMRIGQVISKGNSEQFQFYPFYDPDTDEGKTYYYRIKAVDGQGKEVFSQIKQVKTETGISEFEMEPILIPYGNEAELSLRFSSEYSQNVRIKLLNDRMAEVAILFDDYVFANQPNLLKVSRRLKPGQYLILAITENKRFGKEIEVK